VADTEANLLAHSKKSHAESHGGDQTLVEGGNLETEERVEAREQDSAASSENQREVTTLAISGPVSPPRSYRKK